MSISDTAFREFHRSLIQAHPTFACPITKEILDIDESYVVQYLHPSKGKRIDIISKNGWKKLTPEQRNNVGMTILTSLDEE